MAQLQEVFLFQPTSVSGCQLWLDGADPNGNGSSVANGASVSTWTDKSGNGRNATAGANATFSNSGVYFNGTSYLDTTYTALPTIESIFIVYNLSSSPGYYTNLIGPSASGGRAISLSDAAPYFLTWDRWGSAVFGAGASVSGITFNTRTLTTGLYNGTGSISLNGSNQSSGSAGSFSGSGTVTRIGRGPLTAGGIIGFLFEVIIFNTFVSTSQRQQIEGYLAWKWGLQGNLPATHPYKNYRPIANNPVPTNIPLMPIITQNTSVFNPASISGCQLWLDAADPTSFSLNASVISQWRDKSGNGRTATTAGAPVLQQKAINGLPSIYYDGIAGGSFTGSISITTTSIFAFAVFISNMTGSSEGMRILSFSGSGTADWNSSSTAIMFLYDTNRIQTWRNSSTTTNLTCPAQGSTILTTTYYNGSIAYNSLFGGASSSAIGSSGSFNITNYNMTFGNINMKGFLGEVIVYNSVLSTAQLQQIEGYLAWKWGVTSSLPSNHPYRLTPFFPIVSPLMTTTGSVNMWLPTSISGCQLWLDVADRSSFTLSGSTLTSWSDKSGTSKTITINSAPTYSATGFNTSYPTFSFTTSNLLTTTLSSAIGMGDCMFVAVIRNTGVAGQNDVLSVGQPAGTTEMAMGWNNGETLYKFYQYANGEGKNTSAGNNANIILIGTRLSSLMSCFVNGNPPSSTGTNSVNNTNTTIYIGGGGTSFTYSGEICEIILYVGTTTTTQRQQVEGYLAWKWGLVSSLPANHPYKKWPPSP